jgi:DNA ligase (NAD+)
VIIQRAGDVIPDVIQVLPRLRTGKEKGFRMPRKCPACGSSVIRPEGEVVHRCSNSCCGAIQRKNLYHFVSKKAFDIVGLGPKIINQLMDERLVSNPADLFELEEGDLLSLERFAKKSASNLVEAIENSKKIPFHRFIYALGIRHIGEETAIDLANHFGNLERLKKAEIEDFFKVKDTGEIMAKSIYKWLREKRNLKLLERLAKVGVRIISAKRKVQSAELKGRVFVLTGELETMTRDEAKEKIRQMGGDISSSVSKSTDFVVIGAEPGSKYDKAKKLSVKIISEDKFLKMFR